MSPEDGFLCSWKKHSKLRKVKCKPRPCLLSLHLWTPSLPHRPCSVSPRGPLCPAERPHTCCSLCLDHCPWNSPPNASLQHFWWPCFLLALHSFLGPSGALSVEDHLFFAFPAPSHLYLCAPEVVVSGRLSVPPLPRRQASRSSRPSQPSALGIMSGRRPSVQDTFSGQITRVKKVK